MDYKIVNVFTDINAYDCTWRCKDTVREFALKVDSGRVDWDKSALPHRGIESACAANRSDALPAEL